MEDDDPIQEEIMVLQDMFPEKIEFNPQGDGFYGKMDIHLSLNQEVKIVCNDEEGNPKSFKVKYLPPFKFHFELHSKYPAEEAPGFMLTSEWLSTKHLSALCKELDSIWEKNCNMVVIYNWINFLQNSLEALNLASEINITQSFKLRKDFINLPQERKHEMGKRIDRTKYSSLPRKCSGKLTHRDDRCLINVLYDEGLIDYLKAYDKKFQEEKFKNDRFTCNVCIEEKKGKDFFIFKRCHHMFCRKCVKDYFELQIRDGQVKLLNCMEKPCDTQAIPSQVYELVGPKLFERYDELLLSTALSEMSDIKYCPKPSCQCALITDAGSMVGICPKCQFSFCVYCKSTYHGINPCKINRAETQVIIKAYETADEQSKTKMLKQYGKNLLNLIDDNRSQQWIDSNSKKCPNCSAVIEKTMGCQKMTCSKCNSFFCWLCLKKLDSKNPYGHFSDAGGQCFNKLFEGVEPEEDFFNGEDDEDWQFGQFL